MKRSITILEDDEDIREICIYLFTDAGYNVRDFGTVADFMAGLKTTDLFLLDIRLPDGSGIDVCQMLKHDLEYQAVPIILMSAHMDVPAMKEHCQADGFIAKPFSIDQLLQQVRALLS